MKRIYLYKYLMLAFAAIILGSCAKTEIEPKFDTNATERLRGRQKELNDLLLSSAEGWKAVYYTDSTQLGGWTHLFKFLPEGKVDMVSDFDSDTAIHRSQYEIQVGSTVSLVFTTANRIHLLSDGGSYPVQSLKGKGYLGNFQFFYFGQKNGEIIFRTNSDFQELRFKKATAKDWTDFPKTTQIINALTGNDLLIPLYKVLMINDGTTSQNYDFNYNPDTRFLEASPVTTGSLDVLKEAFSFTPVAAVINPPLAIKGQKLSDFVYDNTSKTFLASGTNGLNAVIKFTNIPPRLTDDYKVLLNGNNVSWRFIYDLNDNFPEASKQMENAPTNSQLFKNEIAKINAKLTDGITISSVQLILNYSKLQGNFPDLLKANGDNFVAYETYNEGIFDFVYHAVDVVEDAAGKKVILKSKYWSDGKDKLDKAPAYLTSFDNYLVNDSGIYVKKENFKVFYNLGSDIYTFANALSPFRMTTWGNN